MYVAREGTEGRIVPEGTGNIITGELKTLRVRRKDGIEERISYSGRSYDISKE